MTPETLICDKCGAVLRIETDDHEYLDKQKDKFIKNHEGCLGGACENG